MKRRCIVTLVVLLAIFLYSGTVFSQEQEKSEEDRQGLFMDKNIWCRTAYQN